MKNEERWRGGKREKQGVQKNEGEKPQRAEQPLPRKNENVYFPLLVPHAKAPVINNNGHCTAARGERKPEREAQVCTVSFSPPRSTAQQALINQLCF